MFGLTGRDGLVRNNFIRVEGLILSACHAGDSSAASYVDSICYSFGSKTSK